jgi:hypothetical protein
MTLWKQGRPLFPFLPGFGSFVDPPAIGIGGVLPIGTALVTEFAPTMIVMGVVGVALGGGLAGLVAAQFMSIYGSHDFISPATFSAWVMTACTSMTRVRGLVGLGASLTGSPAVPDVSAVARSWRGGAGTIEADSLRLVGTARGCPVRPQNFAM